MEHLGTGFLMWQADQRITRKYKKVMLLTSLENLGNSQLAELAKTSAKKNGSLKATVQVVRDSAPSRKDEFYQVQSEIPEQGETVTLGHGILFFEGDQVGIVPTEKREGPWLDPKGLYRVSGHFVSLYFEPDKTQPA